MNLCLCVSEKNRPNFSFVTEIPNRELEKVTVLIPEGLANVTNVKGLDEETPNDILVITPG